MDNLRDYIKVYDNIIPNEICDTILKNMEQLNLEEVAVDDLCMFKQLSVTDEHTWEDLKLGNEIYSDASQFFADLTFQGGIAYFEDLQMPLVPGLQGFEGIKIVKYDPTQNDKFDIHSDVPDYKAAKRFLGVKFFLNDSDVKIIFPTLNYTYTAKKGSVMLFPPMWMYQYEIQTEGCTTPLIFAKTYLHYLSE